MRTGQDGQLQLRVSKIEAGTRPVYQCKTSASALREPPFYTVIVRNFHQKSSLHYSAVLVGLFTGTADASM